METPHHINTLIHGPRAHKVVLESWISPSDSAQLHSHYAPLPLGLSCRTQLWSKKKSQDVHTTQKNTSLWCNTVDLRMDPPAGSTTGSDNAHFSTFPIFLVPQEIHSWRTAGFQTICSVKPTFRCNFAFTSVALEALYKKGLTLTYTCTTDAVVASWSVKATPEERPVKLSPWWVMLTGESSDDKSSFISSGHSGSGSALEAICAREKSPDSVWKTVAGWWSIPQSEDTDFNIYDILCGPPAVRTDVCVVVTCLR